MSRYENLAVDAERKEPRPGQARAAKSRRSDYKQASFWLPKDLVAAFKAECARQELLMSDVMDQMIRAWLDSQVDGDSAN